MTDDDQFDMFAGRAGKADGMERAAENAHEDWMAAAEAGVFKAALELPAVTSDDVFDRIPDGIETDEHRAMGPIMLTAARSGWLIKTGQMVPCRRPVRHLGDVRVWRSLLYDGGDEA
jgi:hypothetical protein